ncbi:hypothetical protein [Haloflavibacter putidus]|uniref:Uncharacterized protein n=1 Tax=Haloflavibacter putidus TaxID=2576776 RepID=A0A507ZD34_9FLAO|nr:hypothetical protein [Haloflavibacter putidus]TQD34817.1 hypothetical protein FKR84_11525 [Haloflavibacter putidus]
MKKTLVLLCLLLVASINKITAQNNFQDLNNYKFVVVPLEYKLFEEENKYLLNSLTKHLLDQAGFTTYVETDPKLANMQLDRCVGLYADITGTPQDLFSFNTVLQLQLKDCKGNIIYETPPGKSKLKKYKEAYQEALRESATVLSSFNYTYNGGEGFFENRKTLVGAEKDKENETPLDRAVMFDYSFGNNLYNIQKIEAGYILESMSTKEKLAHLHYNKNQNILYNSKNINGTATLENGDIIVEYFDVDAGRLKKLIFERVSK